MSIYKESQPESLIFISYRRHDSSAAARWLCQSIQRTFGPSTAFVDTESIRIHADWQERISKAIELTTILIVVIGPDWIGIADQHGRRRLDLEDDSVRNVILHALENRIIIIPLLLLDTPMPDQESLPTDIRQLSSIHPFCIRDNSWEEDLNALLSQLQQYGLKKRSDGPVRYRKPCLALYELSDHEMSLGLQQLPGWELSVSDLPGKEPLKRREIRRIFEFRSFEAAIEFMSEAAKHISSVDHHPRWENSFRNVSVWLTTWDIGHRPSRSDLELARYLEHLYWDFKDMERPE